MKILLVTEYSGGHFFPAYILAHYLGRICQVYIFTPSSFFHNKFKKNYKIIGKAQERRKKTDLFYHFFESLKVILEIKPTLVFGFGGRCSFFFVFWASLLGIDTAIYEPNAKWGRSNRILRFLAEKIYSGFDLNSSKKIKKVGIPLPINLKKYGQREAKEKLGLKTSSLCVLCMGGSQGSSFINQVFKRLVEKIKNDIGIIHLTGRREYYSFLDFYDKIIKRNYFVKDFFEDMGLLYSAADIVISRAGALSLAEINYFKLPSILIPYPGAGGHQWSNAEYFARMKAAYLVPQGKNTFVELEKLFTKLVKSKELRETLRRNLARIRIYEESYNFFNNIFGNL